MPVQRPHYWHEMVPLTSNQTYGVYLRGQSLRYSAKDEEALGKGYTIIRKPRADLSYRAYRVPICSETSELPPIINARNRDRKPLTDSLFSRSAPWLTDSLGTKQPWDNVKQHMRPFSSMQRVQNQSMSFNPEYIPYRSQTALGTREKECSTKEQSCPDQSKPLYLYHTNSGYLVRVVP